MIKRKIIIDGVEHTIASSGLIPKLYRNYFGKDIFRDMMQLKRNFEKAQNVADDASEEEREDAALSAFDLEIFERIGWLFLKHGGEDIPDNPDEWLESMDGACSIFDIMPAILELWSENQIQTSTPKKK